MQLKVIIYICIISNIIINRKAFSSLNRGRCPQQCTCLWRRSKITADCSKSASNSRTVDLRLSMNEFDLNTQVLNLTGNYIEQIPAQYLVQFGLYNLQRFEASHSGITTIHPFAFQGLENLIGLVLAYNKLTEVPTLRYIPLLMELSLRGNMIKVISEETFRYARQLKKLDLSYCQIEFIGSEAFSNLDNLQRLLLHSNRLKQIGARDFPLLLHGITVHQNPWECDCHLRGFRLWLSENNVPRPEEPICGRHWGLQQIINISPGEMACPPQPNRHESSPSIMKYTLGSNISIQCAVESDPAGPMNWYLNGRRIFNQNEKIFPSEAHTAKIVRSSDGSQSHLFINNIKPENAGKYFCQATNPAGATTLDFTIELEAMMQHQRTTEAILHVRIEYFIAASLSLISILVVILIAIVILMIRVCRQKLPQPSNMTPPSKQEQLVEGMKTRKIKMGLGQPDLLVDHAQQQPNKIKETTEKSLTNYRKAMENIIHDYSQMPCCKFNKMDKEKNKFSNKPVSSNMQCGFISGCLSSQTADASYPIMMNNLNITADQMYPPLETSFPTTAIKCTCWSSPDAIQPTTFGAPHDVKCPPPLPFHSLPSSEFVGQNDQRHFQTLPTVKELPEEQNQNNSVFEGTKTNSYAEDTKKLGVIENKNVTEHDGEIDKELEEAFNSLDQPQKLTYV